MGVGGIYAPTYRGSEISRGYVLPFPLVRYRGERFRVEGSGARQFLYLEDRVRLDISFAGGLPAPSTNTGARQGMPYLDPTIEGGPALELVLAHSEEWDRIFWLKTPLRAVISIGEGGLEYRGWVFAPFVEYEAKPKPWEFSFGIGPQFATGRYHDYYYTVAPEFATADRRVYDAAGGYSGSRITITANRDFGDDITVGLLLRYDYLGGTVFEDSPLVETRHYVIYGFALTWTFARSETMVVVVE